MKLPANNEDGYRRTAPRFAAGQLHGRMLLVHGTMDDNVHMQNSVQFAYELQRAGKSFDAMIYPRSRHSFSDARLNTHLRQLMFDFVMKTVGTARTAKAPSRRRAGPGCWSRRELTSAGSSPAAARVVVSSGAARRPLESSRL